MKLLPNHRVLKILLFSFLCICLTFSVARGQNTPPPQLQGAGAQSLDKRIEGPMTVTNMDLDQVMMMLQAESGMNMVLGEGVKKKVTFNLTNPTIREVLETVLPANGLAYTVREGGVVYIDTTEKIAEETSVPVQLVTRVFTPRYIPIEQLLEALEGMMSPDGSIIPDPDSQKIIVKDIPEAVSAMEEVIMQLDVQTEWRVFDIKYGNVQEIADQLIGVVNTIEGEMFINPRLNQIVIRDIPERLDRAAAIIEQLDRQIQPAVIPLAFALPEDVLPLIESFLTEMGWVDFDPRTSRIIIYDIPAVQKQAMELIKQIDIATQQVYIETDIITVNEGKSLTFGATASFGDDIGREGPASPSVGSATADSGYFSFNPFLTTSGSGLTLMDVNKGSFRYQIEALVEDNLAEVIASPRLLVQDGGVGSFNLGSQEPYSTRMRGGYGGYGGYGGDYYTQQFRSVGTSLMIEAYISEAGYIEMYISVEDTNSRRVNLSNVGEALAIDGSFIETQATVKSGQTVVLGGIINRTKEKSQSGVPVISKIPILGNLFKKKSSNSQNDKLLIFITPQIVSVDDPYEFTQVDNVQRVKDMRLKGVTDFIETKVDEKYLDWSKEKENEQAAIEKAIEEGIIKIPQSEQKKEQKSVPLDEQMDAGMIQYTPDD